MYNVEGGSTRLPDPWASLTSGVSRRTSWVLATVLILIDDNLKNKNTISFYFHILELLLSLKLKTCVF